MFHARLGVHFDCNARKLAVILFLFCMAEHMVTFGQSFWSKAMEKELQTVSLQIDDIELLGAAP